MTRIAVCVPLFDPHEDFIPHFIEWYAANKREYDLRLAYEYKKPLHKIQAAAVDLAQKQGCTHILFVEDDHWGFPVDGLETLLAEDKDVVGFVTVSKSYPFHTLCMRRGDSSYDITYTGHKNMFPFERAPESPEVQTTDLLSWAFTLVKIEVFEKLQEDPFRFWGDVPTDSEFCQQCELEGIERHVHFGYLIPHGDVTAENRGLLRQMHSIQLQAGALERKREQDRSADVHGDIRTDGSVPESDSGAPEMAGERSG